LHTELIYNTTKQFTYSYENYVHNFTIETAAFDV
jgi:hypothetical protein